MSAATKPTLSTTTQAADPGSLEVGEHDQRLRLDRAADEHRLAVDHLGQLGRDVVDLDLRGPVEDHPHRAVRSVLGDEDDRTGEVRVGERR